MEHIPVSIRRIADLQHNAVHAFSEREGNPIELNRAFFQIQDCSRSLDNGILSNQGKTDGGRCVCPIVFFQDSDSWCPLGVHYDSLGKYY